MNVAQEPAEGVRAASQERDRVAYQTESGRVLLRAGAFRHGNSGWPRAKLRDRLGSRVI